MAGNYLERIDATAPRKHLRLNEKPGTTVATNRGSVGGDGAYQNIADMTYRLATLVQDNDSGRSIALGGARQSPAHITIADLVTTASFTLDIAVQLDVHKRKHVLITTGGGTLDGQVSLEVQDDDAGGLRLRQWTVVDGTPNAWVTGAATVPIGDGCKITLVQRSDAVTGGRWLYVDGVPVGTNEATRSFAAPPPGTWFIGAWSSGADPIDGVIAEVAGWDRALSEAEIISLARAVSILQLDDWSVTVDGGSSGTLDPAPHANPSAGWTTSVVSNDGIVNLTAAGALINYVTGATASDVVLSPTVQITKGAVQSRIATISVTVRETSSPPPPGEFDCIAKGGGTLVDLGTADNRETTTNLSTGSNSRYNAAGLISRTRWLGQLGCTSPNNRHDTTEQFLYRFAATHNGGCISGGAIYGNLTQHENYDNTSAGGNTFRLYPCGDGGQIYIARQDISNFTVEGFRFHGCWDPIRLSQRSGQEVIDNVTVKGCWFTCIRDDAIENDTYTDDQLFTDNLIGDVIGTGPTNAGAFRFYSMFGGTTDRTSRRVTISNNLVWASQMKADDRANDIGGYAVGPFFKLRADTCPRINLTNNTFLVDARTFASDGGDPLLDLKKTGNEAINSSSGNRIIWRDIGNMGSYPWSLPPGFTLVPWSSGQAEWNNKVNAWKTAHPHVRRFNKTGIAKPFGGTFDLIDTG